MIRRHREPSAFEPGSGSRSHTVHRLPSETDFRLTPQERARAAQDLSAEYGEDGFSIDTTAEGPQRLVVHPAGPADRRSNLLP